MREHMVTMGKNGRLVIPAEYRHYLHLDAGEKVIISLQDNEIRIFTQQYALEKAQKLVRQHTKGKNLVSQLKQLREEDIDNE